MEKSDKKIIRGAVLGGIINAFINGGIQYFFLKKLDRVPISVDSITNNDQTVLGTAISLSITLAVILTFVGYFGIKEERKKFYPHTFWLAIKHGFFTFGVLTSLAVLWQKYLGTVEVSLFGALVIIGSIAGIVSGVINYLTLKKSILTEE